MPISTPCPGCGKSLKVKEELAGKKIRCPDCKAVVEIPLASAEKRTSSSPATSSRPSSPRQDASTVILPPPSKKGLTSPSSSISGSTTCPSCGKAMPAQAVSCPHCEYNLRLGRKVRLSAAIQEAQTPGVLADGTKVKTRTELAKERVEEGRKISRLMLLTVVLLVLIVLSYASWRIYHVFYGATIPGLIEEWKVKEVSSDPTTFHPARVGSAIDIEIPLSELHLEKFTPPPSDLPETTRIAAFVEANALPYIKTSRGIFGPPAECIRSEIDRCGGAFSPKAILAGNVPTEAIVWRRQADLTVRGSLIGAVLDLGANRAAIWEAIQEGDKKMKKEIAIRQRKIERLLEDAAARGEELSREMAEKRIKPIPPLRLKAKGILTFIPFYKFDLRGGPGTYAEAVREGADRVRNPAAKTTFQGEQRGANLSYFIPVLIVESAAVAEGK